MGRMQCSRARRQRTEQCELEKGAAPRRCRESRRPPASPSPLATSPHPSLRVGGTLGGQHPLTAPRALGCSRLAAPLPRGAGVAANSRPPPLSFPPTLE
eukprot:scaffold243964_cov27-Tisochrysis_lutea.AAC.3